MLTDLTTKASKSKAKKKDPAAAEKKPADK